MRRLPRTLPGARVSTSTPVAVFEFVPGHRGGGRAGITPASLRPCTMARLAAACRNPHHGRPCNALTADPSIVEPANARSVAPRLPAPAPPPAPPARRLTRAENREKEDVMTSLCPR